jgi:hypothetical protein
MFIGGALEFYPEEEEEENVQMMVGMVMISMT